MTPEVVERAAEEISYIHLLVEELRDQMLLRTGERILPKLMDEVYYAIAHHRNIANGFYRDWRVGKMADYVQERIETYREREERDGVQPGYNDAVREGVRSAARAIIWDKFDDDDVPFP
ncbi:MAG: hypothetical protein ISS36_00125 [Candidatus Aenigmarchaeota archaeon]|nr:hypothetical protein [Candidatus Aenigmarchaeota archaeon]